MKNIILLLLLTFPVLLFAQYPTTGNKQRLGWQTTADGLVYRDAGYPSYTPNSRNNAYVYMDTVAKRYYHFANGAWYDLSDEKYIHRQDQSVLALAVRDSLTTYDRLFVAMEITSGASVDRGVQLPVTALDSTYAGRVVRVSSLDSSGTYNVFVSSSSPDGLLVNGALATTYYLAADETAEFQLYVFDTIYQWRLINTTVIPPDVPQTLSFSSPNLSISDGNSVSLSPLISGLISLTSLSATAPLQYNNTTGVFSIPLGTNSVDGYLSATDRTNFQTAYTNRITSLTTTGSSGAATLLSNVLNVPNYTLAGLLGVGGYGNGVANQWAYWSDANTVTTSNQLIRDANRVSLGTLLKVKDYSTVGTPAAVGQWDIWGDNTVNGYKIHNGTRAGFVLESTFPRGTTGSAFFADANGQIAQDNSNLFWNNTNKRFGIGTNNPTKPLHVKGAALIDASVTQIYSATSLAGNNHLVLYNSIASANNTAGIIFEATPATGIDHNIAYMGTYSINSNSGSVLFFGTRNTGGSYSEKMRIHTNGFLGIGNIAPTYILDITSTDAARLPVGTTAQEPTNALGLWRTNSSTTKPTWNNGSGFLNLATEAWVTSNFTNYTGWTLAGDTGTPQSIGSGNTATVLGGYGINTTASATRNLTVEVDTAEVATQYDLTQLPDLNGLFSSGNEGGTIAVQQAIVDQPFSITKFLSTRYSGDGGDSVAYVHDYLLPTNISDVIVSGVNVYFTGAISYLDDSYNSGLIIMFLNGIILTDDVGGSGTGGVITASIYFDAPYDGTVANAYIDFDQGGDKINTALSFYFNSTSNSTSGAYRFTTSGTGLIRFYDKYFFANETPSTTSGARNIHIWTGTGSSATPSFTTMGELYKNVNYTNQTSTSSPMTLIPGDNLINQGGTQATFTFNLPSSPTDGTICNLTFVNAVTACTVANGTILGASVTTAPAGTRLEYKYYTSASTWIRLQ